MYFEDYFVLMLTFSPLPHEEVNSNLRYTSLISIFHVNLTHPELSRADHWAPLCTEFSQLLANANLFEIE